VITVGSTHGSLPYNMGAATSLPGDQRQTAVINLISSPRGEGINGPIPLINDVEADYKSYDGTIQAAAHVSGAAAMILARYPGMRGDPRAVKKALCESASDLGRERYFQGAGLVDILRALQSL
jgi:serine protease AprX